MIENDSYYEVRDALDVRWAQLLGKLGWLPVILPTAFDFGEYFRSFKIDGVVLSGGNDLALHSDSSLSRKRDAFEMGIIKFALNNDIPVFGICRGMQILAQYFNCTFKKIDGHVGSRHKLVNSDRSRYKDDLAKLNEVNSFHNYGIDIVHDDLIVSARSEDDAVEAIEHKHYKVFGQMWHSERETPFSDVELNIISKFFN
ncbi:MAG: gamma-glutamyl-gamma-aminobutyrate hydrolase family protein [Deltaproteobacteria bacterium]|nr:gamma-glutamyl-gamma-aminobutyrate hydrolase family protein [Deltaproteobacteria bacterium]